MASRLGQARPGAAPSGVVAGSCLAEPHHDTGPSYLVGHREPGAVLTARLWVPAGLDPEQVVLRQVVDGEPAITLMERVADDGAGTWWHGPVRLVNPLNRYRFLLLEPGAAEPYLWVTAAGTVDHDPADATDFAVLSQDTGPDWVLDAVVYQVFPDRFARHTDPRSRRAPAWAEPRGWLDEPPVAGDATGTAWYGGDLDGVVDHLDYLQGLGVDTVYLTPVFQARSVHRYDSVSFAHVDPLLGGDEALERLSRALHTRGMRLLLDLTTNHTGDAHEWFRSAVADPHAPEASFYSFRHHPDDYAAWLDVPSLPKLDHRSGLLRDRLLRGPGSVTAHWLTEPFNADGWRTDVANMTGRHGPVDLNHQVAADMRATMAEVEADTGRPLWLVAEHGHDASRDLEGTGWHGTMSYVGFTRPLWSWLSDPDPADALTWLGIPTAIPHRPGNAVVRGVRSYHAHMPATSVARSMNLLSSHDTPRVRTVVGSRDAHLVAATALFTAPGVPTVFAGDELGATGRTGEHSRTTIPWSPAPTGSHHPTELADHGSWGPVDRVVLERYRQLSALRRSLPALRRGGLRWVHAGDDVVAWVRTHPAGDVLVVLARCATAPLRLPLAALHARGTGAATAFDGVAIVYGESGALDLSVRGPGSAVVVLEPAVPARPAPPTENGDSRASAHHPD
ncbi:MULTISPECIES: glycoside hydrolase family 13 protein [unclassified Actinomyces]|uniref:glycoside hydrolase family 13 protein n=3 Tax=Actinomyces TaxID=1654 RepID=UPI00201817D5|nr:glycoside hydrolase family 13 protein [Actinomyces sp. 187325]MCL3777930.1 glycoside hydrolase family 13 protein [Actinomyces sp. AC-20-1]MCL3788810.1 glycoside hydrolase family 13 protein [Actinomyces sp. 187325]MCL3791146.1 glycoside hydrolase family 13 protein [Actinomyces sp. 186855]MCL3793707.1 glycoside hydrolase family 13 protein [Actinomyces sp. 217892]